ncbi:MAG TPA: CoA-binding protein [Tepidisphaeraceae bacterium]|nr:CoA-binding protein [Tepidisphaeraceae bacterium]
MPDDACPLPTRPGDDESAAIRRMLAGRRIAVVGLSDDPSRPSHDVASYLISAGKDVIPVNPNHRSVLGRRCYASLDQVPGPIDLVDVFRRPEHCAEVARQAVAVGAKGLWLQAGIASEEAERIAAEAGIDFVQDRCLKVELMFSGQ